MSKRKVVTLVIILCGLLFAPSIIGAVLAMESANYAINWDVIGSGGEPSSSASFALDGTIGQGVVSSSSGASYGLCSGYWCNGEIEVHITYALDVSKAGDGDGTVSSTPAGIDCGTDCTQDYVYGTVVTLTAAASTGSTFGGWSGAGCGGMGDCVVTIDTTEQVTATFTLNTYTLDVNKAGDGDGTVSSIPAGIDCGTDCTQDYVYGTVVALTAVADSSSTFDGWSGDECSGAGDCVVTMDATRQVTATFTVIDYNIYLPLVMRNQ